MKVARGLVALGGAALAVSPFLSWTRLGDGAFFGALDRLEALEQTGWQQAPALAVGLVFVGLLLLAVAVRPFGGGEIAALPAVAAIVVAGVGISPEGSTLAGAAAVATVEAGMGPRVAIAGAVAALLGFALRGRGQTLHEGSDPVNAG